MFDLVSLVTRFSYLGLFGVVFAESGLFVGFFLPGDSLLFTAGFLASQGIVSIYGVLVASIVGAILGDSFGYAFGRRIGPTIFTREQSFFFNPHHVQRTQQFYGRHGKSTIVLARFMPIVRTFAPILAGVGRMEYKTFLTYNVLGGTLWGCGLPFLGYYLGNIIPNIDRYIVPIVVLIIIISVIPSFFQFRRARRRG